MTTYVYTDMSSSDHIHIYGYSQIWPILFMFADYDQKLHIFSPAQHGAEKKIN